MSEIHDPINQQSVMKKNNALNLFPLQPLVLALCVFLSLSQYSSDVDAKAKEKKVRIKSKKGRINKSGKRKIKAGKGSVGVLKRPKKKKLRGKQLKRLEMKN